MKSTTQKILDALLRGETVTAESALKRWKCTRLSGRIMELRQRGYDIQTRLRGAAGEYYLSTVSGNDK